MAEASAQTGQAAAAAQARHQRALLRAVLVAGVVALAIMEGRAIAVAFLEMRQVEALIATDKDALRVMCATKPPTRQDQFAWATICEAAAGVASAR